MTVMKIKSIFTIIQGHQITDEEIYKSFGRGNIPIYTSSNEIKGYWDKAIVTKEDLPCITYPTKANVGEAFVQYEVFDANNTAVLIPLPEWRPKIILEWAAMKLGNIFLDIATSKEGVSYLNREIVEEYEMSIPLKDVQEKQLKYYQEIKSLKSTVDKIQDKINRLFRMQLTD
jgi:hypothetical protein